MVFLSKFFTSTTLLVAVVELSTIIIPVGGLPLDIQSRNVQLAWPSRRGVYNPKITSPVNDTVWKVGEQVEVTWDPQSIPYEYRRRTSKVVLGYIEPGSPNEHLDLDHPLANGFKLKDGRVTFIVPRVAPKANYIVVLFGDSGNSSPKFSIKL